MIKVVQQAHKLKIKDWGGSVVDGCGGIKHSPLLHNTIRCIVCGPSNCGKTNVVFNMLFDANGLCFENVYVFSKSLFQPKYRMLNTIMRSLSGIGYFA